MICSVIVVPYLIESGRSGTARIRGEGRRERSSVRHDRAMGAGPESARSIDGSLFRVGGTVRCQ